VRLLILGLVATLGLHFAWEMLQAPAFEPFAPTVWAGTVLRASAPSALDLGV
jgi:hypothetical protein